MRLERALSFEADRLGDFEFIEAFCFGFERDRFRDRVRERRRDLERVNVRLRLFERERRFLDLDRFLDREDLLDFDLERRLLERERLRDFFRERDFERRRVRDRFLRSWSFFSWASLNMFSKRLSLSSDPSESFFLKASS